MRENSPSTSRATPPARTSSGARYQIRRGWILAGGAASGTGIGPGPPSPGAGVIGVAIVPSLINAHPGGPDCHQQGPSWFTAAHRYTQCWLLLRLHVAGGWRGDPDGTASRALASRDRARDRLAGLIKGELEGTAFGGQTLACRALIGAAEHLAAGD